MKITQNEAWKIYTANDGYWMRYSEDIAREKLNLHPTVRFDDIIFTDARSAIEIASKILKEYPADHGYKRAAFEHVSCKKDALDQIGARSEDEPGVEICSRVKSSHIQHDEQENKVVLMEELEVCLKRTVTVVKNTTIQGETWTREDKEILESSWYPAGTTQSAQFYVCKIVQTVISQ
jgi:hypothetical protein